MAISFVDAQLTNPPGTNANITGNMPVGTQAGDLLICFCSENKAATITDPGGSWILLDGPISETAQTSKTYYLISSGSDTAPTASSATTGQWRMDIAAYRGVDNTTPFIAHGGQVEAGSTATHSAPALTNTDSNAWGVFAAAFRQVATPSSWTPGAGLTERTDADTGVAGTGNMAQCFCDSNGPVATGSVTYSATGSASSAQATMWAAFLTPAAVASVTKQIKAPTNRARFRAANW